MLKCQIFKLNNTWLNKEYGLDPNYKLLSLDRLLMHIQDNLFGKRFTLNRMVYHKLQNLENIGLNFIIWVNQLKYKLMIEFQ